MSEHDQFDPSCESVSCTQSKRSLQDNRVSNRPPVNSIATISSAPANAMATAIVQRFHSVLRRKWWVPVAMLFGAVIAQGSYLFFQPRDYTAVARLWVGGKIKLQESALFSEEWQNFFGTQIELMEGAKIGQRALARIAPRFASTNVESVKVEVTQPRKTAIFVLQAHGGEPAYLEAYLNAVIDEYLNYKREVRLASSDDTLTSLSDQVDRHEKDLRAAEEKLLAFQSTNNLAVLTEESTVAANYLAKLKVQLAELKLEARLADLISTNQVFYQFEKTNGPLVELDGRKLNEITVAGVTLPADHAATRQQVALLRLQRAQLVVNLRGQHPKIIKLDEDIGRFERWIEVQD